MQTARRANLRRVLAGALGTEFYRPWLEAAALHSPRQIAELPDPEEVLRRLPPLSPTLYTRRMKQFSSLASQPAAPSELHHRLPGKPRIAVLAPGFRTSRAVREFSNGLDGSLARFRPQVLAGPPERLEQLAQDLQAGRLSLPCFIHAVIVLLRPDEPLLGEAPREQFWAVFQAPVFQQVAGFDGRLLAWECEAHDGLHVVRDHAIVECYDGPEGALLLVTSLTDSVRPMLRLNTPWQGTLTRGLCGCGQPGERIRARAGEAAGGPADASAPVAGRAAAAVVLT